jgi:hypothetical protein
MLIRPMELHDCAACSRLDAATPLALFEKRLGQKESVCLVVELGGDVAAFAVLKRTRDGQEADCLRLFNAERGAPLGVALIGHVKATLKATGVKKIVGRCDPALLKYYERQGLKAVGKLPNFFGVGKDAVALEILL